MSFRHAVPALILAASMTAGLAACDDEVPAVVEAAADADSMTIAGPEARFLFTVDDGLRVSPILDVPGGALRVGFLLDLWADRADAVAPHIEARGFDAEGRPTPWVSADVTFAEFPFVVGRAEMPRRVVRAQLRTDEDTLTAMAHLHWVAVVPAVQGEGGLSTVAHALSSELEEDGVLSRDAWGARPNRCGAGESDPIKTRIALHHTATPATAWGTAEGRLRAIQSFHMDTLGWCDIGYHLLVGTDGRVFEGRTMALSGAHVKGHNQGSIGLSLLGCFEPGACDGLGGSTHPTQAALEATAAMVASLAGRAGLPLDADHVTPHDEFSGAQTACPGANLRHHLDDLLVGSDQPADAPIDLPAPAPVVPVATEGQLVGTVYDASLTSGPNASGATRLVAARISIDGGADTAVRPTDASFAFELEPGTYEVSVTAPGYAPASLLATVAAGLDTVLNVGLEPIPADTQVTVVALEIAGSKLVPVDEALVHIAGDGAAAVDASGMVSFALSSTTPSIAVYHPDYVGVRGSVELPAGQASVVHAILSGAPLATGGGGSIQGVVYDQALADSAGSSDDARLDHAIVTCSCGVATTVRNSDAYWRLEVPAGTWEITAIAAGYPEVSRTVTVAPGQGAWGSIGL